MKEIKELTGLYSLTKTIGLELKPVGKTQQLIESKKLIEQDDQRAEDYKIVKDIIDRYHKDFIDKCLNSVEIKKEDLEEYVSLAENSNRNTKDFDEVKTKMRNQITEAFKKNHLFTGLFKKNLIKDYLPDFVSEEEKNVVNKFINPAKRNVLDLKNETCKNREKRNVLKISHTRHFKTTKKQSKTGCFYSF